MSSSFMCFKGNGVLVFLSFFAVWASLPGCSEKSAADRKKYSIYVMARDGQEYIIQTDSLSGGVIDPINKGVRVQPRQSWYDLIVQDGFYYRLERKNKYLIKNTVANHRFQPVDSVLLTGFPYIDNFSWIHPDSLFLTTYNRKSNKLYCARVHVGSMKATTGDLPLPLPSGKYNAMSVGFTRLRGNRLFAGYTYHVISTSQDYTSSDTAYVGVLDYPGLRLKKILKDTRSTYPGGYNTAQPNTFTDENGDFYFLACPGIALGNRPDKPTALYRILKDEDVLDSTFFFNISASSVGNNAYGLWSIGHHQAIVRSERRDLFSGIHDHYKVAHIEFHVLDLLTKKARKLNLPLDKGTSRHCILVEHGLVYISLNSDTAGNDVWIYNPKDGSLKKGLKIAGDVDYILRMERLYKD